MAEQPQTKTTSTKAVDKWKRKKWYTLVAPPSFDQIQLGETPAAKPNLVEGRTLKVTLDKLTGDRKQRHITLTFQVKHVQGLNANMETVGHEIKNMYMSKMVRRRKSKIDSVATVQTKDGKTARVTTTCLCGTVVPKTTETALRKLMVEEAIHTAKRKDFEQFIQELLFGSFAMKVFKRAKALAPIKRIEVVKSHVLAETKTPEATAAPVAAPEVSSVEPAPAPV